MLTVSVARLILLGSVSLLVGLAWYPSMAQPASEFLSVRFLDVGQGDAIHIMTPDGIEMLIDGGPDTAVLRTLAEGRSVFDRSIDVLVATHPDSDHIAGLVDVLERYAVAMILQSDNENETSVSQAYRNALRGENAQVVIARRGQRILLGASTTVEVLAPVGSTQDWPTNASSIMMRISYGEIDFLFTGDAYESAEEALVRHYGSELESEVLKLGHHGSETSTSEFFLDMVQPQYAVVSAGADNRFGHPHRSVVDKVLKRNITLLNTAEQGTIEFQADGKSVWVVN